MKIGYLHMGPPQHGVCRYGHLLAQAASQRPGLTVIEASVNFTADKEKNRELLIEAAQKLSEADVVHFQFSKFGQQLWGDGWAKLHYLRTFFRHCSSSVTVTLHDVYYPPYKLVNILNSLKKRGKSKISGSVKKQLNSNRVKQDQEIRGGTNQTANPKRSILQRGLSFTHTIVKGLFGADALSLRAIAKHTDKLIVCTGEESRRIQDRVDAQKLLTIPHFVEVRAEATTPDEARKELHLDGVKVITLLGFIYPPKGHQILIEAMPNLSEDTVVVFAGGPSSEANETFLQELCKLAKEKGVDHRLRVTGYLSEQEMELYLRATDVAVCPFSRISASGSLSTWISVPRPILASESPQVEELNTIEANAINTFRPYSSTALAEAIKKLLSESPGSQDLAIERLRSKLLMPAIFDRHMDAYMSIANS